MQDDAVAPLAKLLPDPAFCEPATQALLRIRTPNAIAALAKALPAAKPEALATLIQAMGVIRHKPSVPMILKHAASKDARVRRAAMDALANIGDPAAADILAKAAQATKPYERAMATEAYLLFAQRLAQAGLV